MSHRAWWLVISAVVLLCIAVAVQDGLRRGQQRTARDAIAAEEAAMSSARPTAPAGSAGAEAQQARDAAMREAVSTLHTYVAALFKADRNEADALWTGGRPLERGEEELRALTGVTGVRVDNSRPEPLDTLDVPAQLRIPVRLRVGGQGPLRRFEGHYDLQRDVDGWRIRAASIGPSPAHG